MKTLVMFCFFSFILLTAGCGRVSNPASPAGAFYPHAYYVKESVTLPNAADQNKQEHEDLSEETSENTSVFD